ncbi:MAG: zinc ribbon domain-containing protein [Prevotella sp.]
MAKKEAKEMSVEQKLQALYELQTTLTAIDEKRALRGELPLEVQDLEDEIAGLDTRIETIDTEIKEFQSAITMKKGEVQEAQANLERYNNQLNEVRNNREYDSLSKQIDYERLEVELCNKKIKEATDQVAYRTNDLEIAKTEREERQKDLDEKKSELEDILAETREEETMLKERAKDLEVKIEPRLLSSFKRIRKSARNGLGIVYVQRDACGGCFNKIPPQRQLDIKMHKKIIVCEYCGRILIDPELAGVKVENGKAEKPKRKRSTRRKADTEEKKEA